MALVRAGDNVRAARFLEALLDVAQACGFENDNRYTEALRTNPSACAERLAQYQPQESYDA